jgi:hypothetical protein
MGERLAEHAAGSQDSTLFGDGEVEMRPIFEVSKVGCRIVLADASHKLLAGCFSDDDNFAYVDYPLRAGASVRGGDHPPTLAGNRHSQNDVAVLVELGLGRADGFVGRHGVCGCLPSREPEHQRVSTPGTADEASIARKVVYPRPKCGFCVFGTY